MRRRTSFALPALVLPCLVALTTYAPRAANACGGTFCDTGPTAMPVDQTGESIAFWLDETGDEPYTEAHIQIQYDGNAEDFAWIIPVMEVPEVLVGSQPLFDNLLAATIPTFTTTNTTIGDCGFGGSVGFCAKDDGGFNDIALGAGGRGDGGSGGSEEEQAGPEILDRGLAGAFEYVTLTGDDVDEVLDWLDMAGYAQDPDAPPILQEYLDEGFVFVAVKLRGGVDTNEIHPLAIRYPGTEPCIPIRLTRIAAVDDMRIRAFFLGQERVAPSNWPHVVLNHSRFDWVNGPALSYDEVVGLAIDEAGGRAFVTEYAGTDAVVSTSGIHSLAWDPAAFEGIEPTAVVDTLEAQGLAACTNFTCTFTHPLVESLLQVYLPPPGDLDPGAFWACLACYAEDIDPQAWTAGPGFAADFEQRISGPGLHALAMLEDASELTRLYTLISPHEMIEDPLFHPAAGLDAVDNNITATRVTDCDGGPTYYELADGSQVAVTEDGTMPELDDNSAALRIERVPMMGPAQVEVDNSDAIDAALADYNDGRLVGPGPNCSIGRAGLEGLLSMVGIFGIAFFQRRRRR